MPSYLESLPAELLLYTLSYLSTSNLATLAQTSSRLNTLSKTARTNLHLAIFPKNLHATLSFLDAPEFIQRDSKHHAKIALNPHPTDRNHSPNSSTSSSPRSGSSPSLSPSPSPSPCPYRRLIRLRTPEDNTPPQARREATINTANTRAIQILTPLSATLSTLSLLLWNPTEPLLAHLATALPFLRTLNLHFSHPTHRDPGLPAFFFDTAPKPSAIWNTLAGIGPAAAPLVLHNLERLSIERAGITCAQLRGIVTANPHLRELRLKCVRGVDADFVAWLGRRGGIEVLRLESCQDLELAAVPEDAERNASASGGSDETSSYAWITALASHGSVLRQLTIEDCDGVHPSVLRRLDRDGWTERVSQVAAGSSSMAWRKGEGEAGLRGEGLRGAVLGTAMGILEVDPDCL